MAMENGPSIGNCPIKTSIHREFSSQPCLIAGGYASFRWSFRDVLDISTAEIKSVWEPKITMFAGYFPHLQTRSTATLAIRLWFSMARRNRVAPLCYMLYGNIVYIQI